MKDKSPTKKQVIQIPQEFMQFTDIKALFIVTGRQEATFYLAHNGTFKKIESFVISHSKYSDKDGHYMVRGGGKVYSQGSYFEKSKKDNDAEFEKEFTVALNKAFIKCANTNKVYLFSPILSKIYKLMAKAHKDRVVFDLEKDYSHEHPLKLLDAIKK
jgi:hypothetical protein